MFSSNSLENQLQRWNETIRNQPKNPNAYRKIGFKAPSLQDGFLLYFD
jgi:ATP-dependent 26S proteasome regulatory subunit